MSSNTGEIDFVTVDEFVEHPPHPRISLLNTTSGMGQARPKCAARMSLPNHLDDLFAFPKFQTFTDFICSVQARLRRGMNLFSMMT